MRYIYAGGAAYSAPYMSLPGTVVFGAEHGSKLPPISRVAGLPSPENIVHRHQAKELQLGNRFIQSSREKGWGWGWACLRNEDRLQARYYVDAKEGRTDEGSDA
jgi:hypothetical protein